MSAMLPYGGSVIFFFGERSKKVMVDGIVWRGMARGRHSPGRAPGGSVDFLDRF
jgi:hypothetical protein